MKLFSKRLQALSFFVLALIFSHCASAPKPSLPEETGPFVGKFQVHRAQLANGLKVLIVEDHSAPTFAMQTWFRVGSRDEEVKFTGLAHLFEHMMFKGTSRHPEGELDRMMTEAGVEGLNAFTWYDHTAYIQELPKTKLDMALELESDRMVGLIVNDESFRTEREVVQNERRMRKENSPDGTIWQELFETVFTTQPYHWPIIGYEEDLNRMTSQDARDFYQKHYAPNRATIVIVGDVDPAETLQKIQTRYGNLARKDVTERTVIADAIPTAPKFKQLSLNLQVEKLVMVYPIPPMGHTDWPALDLLNFVLSRGKSARLKRALVDTQIATDIDAAPVNLRDPGIFSIEATMQNKASAKTAEAIILRELERLRSGKVLPAELERAKNQFQFMVMESLGTNSRRARTLGEWETTYGDYRKGLSHFEQIQAVTANDLQRVASAYLIPKRRTTLIAVPKKGN